MTRVLVPEVTTAAVDEAGRRTHFHSTSRVIALAIMADGEHHVTAPSYLLVPAQSPRAVSQAIAAASLWFRICAGVASVSVA